MKTSFIPDFWNRCTLAKKGAGAVHGLDWEDWSNSHPWSLNSLPPLLLSPFPHPKLTQEMLSTGLKGLQGCKGVCPDGGWRTPEYRWGSCREAYLPWFVLILHISPFGSPHHQQGRTHTAGWHGMLPKTQVMPRPPGHCGLTLSQYWQMCTQGDAYKNFCDMVLMIRGRKKNLITSTVCFNTGILHSD